MVFLFISFHITTVTYLKPLTASEKIKNTKVKKILG